MNKRLTTLLLAICLVMAPLSTSAAETASAKFTKKVYQVKKGKTLNLRKKLKLSSGNSVKKWKSSNSKIAKINSKGKLVAKKTGTVKITVITKKGKKVTCKVKVVASGGTAKSVQSSGGTVYWTPGGSVYHKSSGCATLKRSKTIYSGSIEDSGKSRVCKVCG